MTIQLHGQSCGNTEYTEAKMLRAEKWWAIIMRGARI